MPKNKGKQVVSKQVSNLSKKLSQGNYAIARGLFLDALDLADNAKFQIEHKEHPINNEKDPTGKNDLFIDTALLGSPDAKRLLVLVSGTHGVEFYAGCGIQVAYLHQLASGKMTLPKDTAILFIHAANPFGAAWSSRFTEDNIDLNRNFCEHPVRQRNLGYDGLAPAFEKHIYQWWQHPIFLLSLIVIVCQLAVSYLKSNYYYRDPSLFRDGEPFRKQQRSTQSGQYHYPNGLFFGGFAPAKSNTLLRKIVDQYCLDAEEIVFFDIHTGLGKKGDLDIIHAAIDIAKDTSLSRCDAIFGPGRVSSSKAGRKSTSEVSVGKLPSGLLTQIVKQQQKQKGTTPTCTGVTLEFGTYPEVGTFLALWARNLQACDENTQKISGELCKQVFKQFFCVDDAQWLQGIIDKSFEVIQQTTDYLSEKESESSSQSSKFVNRAI